MAEKRRLSRARAEYAKCPGCGARADLSRGRDGKLYRTCQSVECREWDGAIAEVA